MALSLEKLKSLYYYGLDSRTKACMPKRVGVFLVLSHSNKGFLTFLKRVPWMFLFIYLLSCNGNHSSAITPVFSVT